MNITKFTSPNLNIDELRIPSGESCCFFGGNSSGLETLLRLLQGSEVEYKGDVNLPEGVGLVSFQQQQEIFEEELYKDDTDFINEQDPGTLVREFLPDWEKEKELVRQLDMERCLDTGFRQLSSGQGRKLVLLMAILGGAQVLVMQNPYDGLDKESRVILDRTLDLVQKSGRQILLFINIKSDVPDWCKNLVIVAAGKISYIGKMVSGEKLELLLESLTGAEREELRAEFAPKERVREELIVLKNGFAGYGDRILFTGLDLEIYSGDHTLVTGQNGCGKSTLLDILTGDNAKCYMNDLRLFGRKRGSGESIWEIKKEMGIVSPTLHRDHRGVGTVLNVVLSGLFDSIGLYCKVSVQDMNMARKWLAWAGLSAVERVPFRSLSYGEQRLVLIARALVKEPKLLLLDEPTQGLDDSNRNRLLDFLEKVADQNRSTIFYISHREDEFRSFFRKQINLEQYAPR